MNHNRIAGVAVSTPLATNLAIDHVALVAHVKQLRDRGMDLFGLFGSTGEGASFSREERAAAITSCNAAGIDSSTLGCGVFSLAPADAAEDCRSAFESGCGHVLLAPPSYYKGIADEGLYRWFSETIEGAGPDLGQFVLYQIPVLTSIDLSVDLVKRLATNFPDVVIGVKDSSSDLANTKGYIEECAKLKILVGHEGQLEKGLRMGATGSIAGTGNFIPEIIRAVVHDNSQQPNLPVFIETLLQHPIIPAVKAFTAHRDNAPHWLRVRPPFTALSPTVVDALGRVLDNQFPN